jgi:hypothetical protein
MATAEMPNNTAAAMNGHAGPTTNSTPASTGPTMVADCHMTEPRAATRGNEPGGATAGVSARAAGVVKLRAIPKNTTATNTGQMLRP